MINFIQIGANVGNTPQDIIWPIVRKNNWSGIFIEPIPQAFTKLKENYSDLQNCYFENLAISTYDGITDIYYEPEWCNQDVIGGDTQIASILYEHSPTRNICKIQVPCVRFETLIKKYNLLDTSFELLQIDAEGYDAFILMDTDFTHILPKYIRFEAVHLRHGISRENILDHLANFGYKQIEDMYKDVKTEIGVEDIMVERQ